MKTLKFEDYSVASHKGNRPHKGVGEGGQFVLKLSRGSLMKDGEDKKTINDKVHPSVRKPHIPEQIVMDESYINCHAAVWCMNIVFIRDHVW